MGAAEDVDALLADYRRVLLDMHANRIETGGKSNRWNRLVHNMQSLHLRLAQTATGRLGITSLALTDPNATVRSWSAVNALAWDADKVRPLLEAEAADEGSLHGFEAKIALREHQAGRLNTAWVPKRRSGRSRVE